MALLEPSDRCEPYENVKKLLTTSLGGCKFSGGYCASYLVS